MQKVFTIITVCAVAFSIGSCGSKSGGMGAEPRSPMILLVDSSATGSNNGTSWTDAYVSLEDTIDESIPGDEIWVAAGTYKPTSGSDRSISFELVEDLALYGGFDGTETERSARDWKTNITILSGDINTAGDDTDNSYHVVKGADGIVLDGFKISGGYATGAYPNERGAGMYNTSGSHTIVNCVFKNNTAITTDPNGMGGGMYNQSCSALIRDCVFTGNSGFSGAGLYNFTSNPGTDVVTVVNCVFNGNQATENGGGMNNYGNMVLTITNCVFYDNTAGVSYSGGGIYNNDCSPLITNCILWDNTDSISDDGAAASSVSYSSIEGGFSGTGNIDADPSFSDDTDPNGTDNLWMTSDDGLRLASGSPCIDAGSNSAVPVEISSDIAGNPRFYDDGTTVDTGEGTAPIVDMGAYEYQ